MEIKVADVAELVDARDLKSLDGNVVWVRVPPPAPRFALTGYAWRATQTVRAKRVRRSLSAAKAKTDRARRGSDVAKDRPVRNAPIGGAQQHDFRRCDDAARL